MGASTLRHPQRKHRAKCRAYRLREGRLDGLPRWEGSRQNEMRYAGRRARTEFAVRRPGPGKLKLDPTTFFPGGAKPHRGSGGDGLSAMERCSAVMRRSGKDIVW